MNERIKLLAEQAGLRFTQLMSNPMVPVVDGKETDLEKFAELIVRECADICMEMSAKCAGLEGDGALAKDCAYWIQKDFGVEL
jgi:hypothetical protein